MHKNKIYLYGKGYDMNSSVSRTPKSIFSVTLLAFFAMAGFTVAQTTDDELKDHPEYTASGYLVYPEPDKSVKYTKAPAGYKPFYISHYGRHGSRYHYSADDYNYLFETLAKADSAKALSVTGKYIMLSSKLLADKAASRAGDLTQKGVKQHEGIAMRMAKNFPDVFKSKNVKIAEVNAKGKQVKKNVKLPPQVDAFASTSGRCIVSMSAFVGGLKSQVPTAQIRMESGKSLMGHINTFNFDITRTTPKPRNSRPKTTSCGRTSPPTISYGRSSPTPPTFPRTWTFPISITRCSKSQAASRAWKTTTT